MFQMFKETSHHREQKRQPNCASCSVRHTYVLSNSNWDTAQIGKQVKSMTPMKLAEHCQGGNISMPIK